MGTVSRSQNRKVTAVLAAVTLAIPLALVGTSHAAAASPGGVEISEFMASNATTILDSSAAASDWVELHNTGTAPVDLTGWTLTDTASLPALWTFPAVSLAPDGYLIVWATGTSATTGELRANFKLSAGGEFLGLRDASGVVVDEYAPTFPVQYTDISYGRSSTGLVGYFPQPTPGAANSAPYAGITTGTVTLSVPHGFYTTPQVVSMTTTQPGATIRYTTDGSTPSQSNGLDYTAPVTIASTTLLRATAVVPDYLPGKVATASYVFTQDVIQQGETPPPGFPTGTVNTQVLNYGMDPDFVVGHEAEVSSALTSIPSISIVTDAKNLFDPATGIYVNAQQKGSAWERPASLELIDPTGGEAGFTIDSGIRIKGGASRNGSFPKHSFKFTFDKQYGGLLNYPLFQAEGASVF